MRPDEREELLAAHALGALPGPEAAEVEALVDRDAVAADQLAVYREIVRLLGVETPLRPADPALLGRMVRSSRRMRRRMRPSGRRRFSVLRAVAIAVSLAVAAVLGGLLGARIDGDVPVERGGDWPPPPSGYRMVSESGEVLIQLHVWQHVEDPWDVWIRARPRYGNQLGDWETPAPIRFPLDEGGTPGGGERQLHLFRDLTVAGTELRLWQRYRAPEVIHVRACVTPCPKEGLWFPDTKERPGGESWDYWAWQAPFWSPLGMIALSLDDGYRELNGERYRYGDLTIAVPVGNPGLQADREHLLALRDALAGTKELNWSAATPTAYWERVWLTAGWPVRVAGLDLAKRNLDGEIWGWLGDLTELTELRLDGNRLTGTVPSKLAQLTKLTQLGLAGNALEGCVPPSLRGTAYHDLDRLGLPDCDPPTLIFERQTIPAGDSGIHRGGTYSWPTGGRTGRVVLDLPSSDDFRVYALRESCPACAPGRPTVDPAATRDTPGPDRCPGCAPDVLDTLTGIVVFNEELWLFVDFGAYLEVGRSHYEEDDHESFRILERIAASFWHTAADEWVP